MLIFDEEMRKRISPPDGFITEKEYRTARLEKQLSEFVGTRAPLIIDVLIGGYHTNEARVQEYAKEFVERVRDEPLMVLVRPSKLSSKLRVAG